MGIFCVGPRETMYARNDVGRRAQLTKSCADADVIRLHFKDYSPSQIGAALGINPGIASNILIRAKIQPHHSQHPKALRPQDPEAVTSICILRALGCTHREIAEALDRSETSVQRLLKRWGGK